MNPARDRVISGLLTVVLFPILCFFILRISSFLETDPGQFRWFVGVLLLLLNLAILFGWLAFGWIGAALIGVISSFLVLLLADIYGIPLYYLNIVIFISSFLAGFELTKSQTRSSQLYKVEIESLEENSNTLTTEAAKHKSQNASLKKKLARYSALKDVTELFSGSLSLDETIGFIIERAHRLIGKSERTLFYLRDTKGQELMLADSRQPAGFPRIKSKKGDIFDRYVLRQKQPLSIMDVDKDFRVPPEEVGMREAGFKSLISHPLIAEKRLLGLIHMDNRKPDVFSPDDLRLLSIISDLGAVAIENAMLYQRTIELAIRDSLTNLYLHRYFRERVDAELERAYLGGYNLALLMIDIDHFKDYNDRYGHTAGDILLKKLAGIFASSVDSGDLVARYGGEEFAILLFETDKEMMRDIAENLRQKTENGKFYLRRTETRISISIGTAVFPIDAKTTGELIGAADRNLYKAKKEGRNRVC